MWLATQYGFYSIVQKPPGQYHVRASFRQDLVNLLNLVRKDLEILEWPSADYRFRLIIEQRELGEIMAALAVSLDYANFKNQIARRPDQRVKLDAFHEVWAILANLQATHQQKDTP